MNKRILSVLIVLAALCSLLVLPANAATADGALLAGYCKVDIDPNRYPGGAITGLPMGGYGAVTERLSSGQMDDTGDGTITTADGLFATCTAITDQYGTTIIHFGVDITNSNQKWSNAARSAAVSALKEAGYDVSYDNIFITASHTHSAPQIHFDDTDYPELTEKAALYCDWVCSQMATAAVSAMKDRDEVTMTKGSVDASTAIGEMYSSATTSQKTMNHVRHYTSTLESSTSSEMVVGGSNFGKITSYNVAEVSAANDVMHLVQFTPVDTSSGKTPIVLINWAAHSTCNSSGGSSGSSTDSYGGVHHTDISSDYVNALRSVLENTSYRSISSSLNNDRTKTIYNNYYGSLDKTQTYRVSFISSAAGNITPSGSVNQDPDVISVDYKQTEGRYYGLKLGAIALYGLENSMSSALDTSAIRVRSKTFTYDLQQPTTSDRDFIYSMREVTVDSLNLIQYLTANSTNWANRGSYYTQFPYLEKFTSRYQLSNMNSLVTQYYDNGKTTGSMTVSAIAIGTQLSITVNPCELADRFSSSATLSNTTDNDWDDLNDSTYGTPLIMGYTNGSSGYVPNSLAYNYNSGSTADGGDGADTSDNYITGSYESSGASFSRGTGEELIVFYQDMLATVNTTESRIQCECGGKATGMDDHVCSDVEFLPWDDATSLPSSGNYYLTTNVTISVQKAVSGNLRLDLNGHTITHEVSAAQGEAAEAGNTHNTRVFSVKADTSLSITDSAGSVGTISRDLTALTDTQKAAINNWGLLILIADTADVTLYDGIYDSTNAATTGGGTCVSNNYAGSNLTIYGGTFKGGTAATGGILYNKGTVAMYGGTFAEGIATSNGGLAASSGTFTMYGGTLTGGVASNAGCIYNSGTASFFGGNITGNKTADNGDCPGIYCYSSGKLTIGGSVTIDENRKTSDNAEINIQFADADAMITNFTVSGNFTGKAGVYVASRTNGQVIGVSDGASFTSDNLMLDCYSDFDIAVSGDNIILAEIRNQCECGGNAAGKTGHTCEKIDFLPWTDTTTLPSSGNYYLLDTVTVSAQQSISGNLRLDLNGKNITHKVAADNTSNTRVFTLSGSACLTITDSTDAPGTVTRDLSNLTEDQAAAITNYGLLFFINGNSQVIVYNGTMDATGMYAGGGACVCTFTSTATFKMYGGALKGGISDTGGIMYNRGQAEFYGGTVTGGVTKIAGGVCGGIYVVEYNEVSGTVTIGGDVEIYDNKKRNENQVNIRYNKIENMADNFIVDGKFTGMASVFIDPRSDGLDIGNSNGAAFTAANLYLDCYSDEYNIALDGTNIVLDAPRTQCECGGKAEGKYGHTCEALTWTPWSDSTSLPTDEGNYYLCTDVTVSAQTSVKAAIRIDLNGHTVTHKVTAAQGAKAEAGTSHNTRVFYLASGGSLSITDSTDNPGTVTRDLSNLTTAQKEAITNYGLIITTSTTTDIGDITIYNGILDASGQYTYGGAVACLNSVSTIRIYGGTIQGGIANTGSSDGGSGKTGAIYAKGPLEIHGGTVTGSTATRDSGIGAVYYLSTLLLTGDPTVTDNVHSNGDACNIYFTSASKITVAGTFTGKVGFNITSPASGKQIAKSSSAVITDATITVDNYPTYTAAVSGSYLVLKSTYVASIDDGETVTYSDSLSSAIEQYPGGSAVLTLLQDSDDTVTFDQDTILDLNGYDLTGNVTASGSLTVMDSRTDDLTVSDNQGYGLIPATLSAEAADGYIKITEDDGTSFHRLILQTVGITLRPSEVGIYYTSDFGGDEVIKRNVESFGIALGANKAPDFRDNTYTAYDSSSWLVGLNSAGNTNNRSNGTILQGILSTENTYTVNKVYSQTKVWGTAYIDLINGTRILEDNTIKFSLRDIIEGYTGFDGVDDRWASLDDTQKIEAVSMYQTYEKTMKNWDIPNIKQGLVDSQDDGVLKILSIGHSIGMDSTYFVPEVFKNETGQDVVIGSLYHSGCRVNQHVDYLTRDATEYAYLEFDTSKHTKWQIWETEEASNGFVDHTPNQSHDDYIGAAAETAGNANKYGVTMQFGIQQHDWDIVVMQPGLFEAVNLDDSSYTPNLTADIKTIQNYVKTNDINKYTTPKFAWNLIWTAPEDTSLTIKADGTETSYYTYLQSEYGGDSTAMFKDIISTYNSDICAAYDWDYMFPIATVVQNAKTILAEDQIYRDYIHGNDMTRLAVAYTWYCVLFDQDISYCSFDPISNALRYKTADRNTGEDFVLTAEERGIVKDCIRNALTDHENVTEIKAQEEVLKVLVIGHSTGMDPAYFMPVIANANGTKMLVGDLYHSSCSLAMHDKYITNNSKEYAYLEYDNTSDAAWRIWETEEGQNQFVTHLPDQAHDKYIGAAAENAGNANKYGVTMDWAVQQHDWDIVIMMGSRWETTDVTVPGNELDLTDIGKIREVVLNNDIDKTTVPEFAWNTLWTNPENDESWKETLSSSHLASYEKAWATVETYYEGSTQTLYESLVRCLQNEILPAYNFDYLLFNNTVIQNAKNQGLTNAEIYRDYTHATDFTRMMIAANWYCGLTGKGIDEITIPTIQAALRFETEDRSSGEAYTLTTDEESLLVEIVGDTLTNPYAVTQ